MNRRGFFRGVVSVMAVAAILKGRRVGDGEPLNWIEHPGDPWKEETSSFGLSPAKPEGGVVSYDDPMGRFSIGWEPMTLKQIQEVGVANGW